MLNRSRLYFCLRYLWHTPIKIFTIASLVAFTNFVDATQPGNHAGKGIIIGLEYAGLDSPKYTQGMASALSETGMPGITLKPFSGVRCKNPQISQ